MVAARPWPGWPAVASVRMLVAVQLQRVLGMNSLLAVHIPLSVSIPALVATLLLRTQSLTRPTAKPRRYR